MSQHVVLSMFIQNEKADTNSTSFQGYFYSIDVFLWTIVMDTRKHVAICGMYNNVNGSQLAKMKKYIPYMRLS